MRVIVSSQAVVLVVILNDHSQRGVLTICPFKGKMIPLYSVTPEHPTTTTAATAKASFKNKSWDNTAFNVGELKTLGDNTVDTGISTVSRNMHKLHVWSQLLPGY